MNKRLEMLLLTLVLLVFVISCAKKGSITGGEKDETPPVFVKAFPPNFSTNFNKNEIRIYFDEYIKLKDAQKQIIISPPMDPKPTITPLGSASKFIRIKFEDTLLQNTTYSINFGESVEDNNEGNTLPFFRYVFSTGDFLDSLSIKGTVNNAVQKKIDPYITVALYEMDENYTDSLIYNTVPRYITNTLDSITFDFYNLKEGKYKLIALKDASSNYLYDPKQDKIGFYEEIITLPADTAKVFNVEIFREVLEFKALLPKQVSKNEFLFPYEGTLDSMKINLLSDTPENFESLVIPDKAKDTLHYWFRPFFETDSLIFEITNSKNYRDTLIPRFKDQYKDSLLVSSKYRSSLPLNENFTFFASTPIDSINKELINLTDKDTLDVPFSISLDKVENEAQLIFEKTESNSYTLQMLPEAIKDYVGNVNDTLNFNFRTKKLADYGIIFLTLQNVESYPVIVEVTNEKDEVISEKNVSKEELITFDYLNPGKYYIRVILDTNKNGKWDTGNFLKGIQPEAIKYFPDVVEVRANWELKQTFILE
ncbi:Ig-like domain-containing protein [Aquimarina gracilis]|uniref:Ig-like domain-containing protein n=1 Tax=Aquimarina gracilis TaxID=874422 RepID=A0ABU6A032_9FLAO|nr:Ig-like domain-containing protein [Aquimarina gracilis]MEB3347500.1 Ig-like domain-containing protein [Aquimarina gracilis]